MCRLPTSRDCKALDCTIRSTWAAYDLPQIPAKGCHMDWAVIVLSLAALGGLVLAGIRLSGAPRPPTWLALGHGAIAATGLGLLMYAASASPGIPQLAQIALGVLLLAALGGATLFLGFHLRGKALPIPIVLGHGLTALAGLVLLLLSHFQVL